MRTKLFFFSMLYCVTLRVTAQNNNYGVKGFYPQTFDITDSGFALLNGLKAGYEIKETDSVSKKDNQARYKIYFYITNLSTEAKIMYQNTGFAGHAGDINNNLALFKCTNATGARLTNKMASMALQPCNLLAKVEDKDCNGKTVINKRLVEIGYWIRPNETVSKSYPMYVPKNEKPKITVTFYVEVANQTGSLLNIANQPINDNISFAHIKNFSANTYINNQNGTLACSSIDNDWWSAQWEIIPVNGTNNFQIRNRWKNLFLSSGNGMLTDDLNSTTAMWTIQESNMTNVFYIKNVSDNARLWLDNGQLKTSNSFISNDNASKWIIEK